MQTVFKEDIIGQQMLHERSAKKKPSISLACLLEVSCSLSQSMQGLENILQQPLGLILSVTKDEKPTTLSLYCASNEQCEMLMRLPLPPL